MMNSLRLLHAVTASGAMTILLLCGLSGCTSTNQAIEQTALIDSVDHLAPWPQPDKAHGVVMQFLPFSGVPVNTADAIYKDIRARTTDAGILIAQRLDEPATYRIRTLINAVGTANDSTFVFIVEIYDSSGKRVHRFVGQEYGNAPSGDAWSGIDGDTERHLAERILGGIKAWLSRSG